MSHKEGRDGRIILEDDAFGGEELNPIFGSLVEDGETLPEEDLKLIFGEALSGKAEQAQEERGERGI